MRAAAREREEPGSAPRLAVDLSLLGDAGLRDVVQRELKALGHPPFAYRGFWSALASRDPGRLPARLVVMADLARLAEVYKKTEVSIWADCFRRASPLLIAFVRRRADERCAHLVDDMLRASMGRLWVYTLGRSAKRDLHACLLDCVELLDPGAVLNVRYSEPDRTVWIEFADGLQRAIPWSALNLASVRPALLPETIRLGQDPETIEMLDASGGVFDLDAAAVRAMLDRKVTQAHVAVAEAAVANLGERLRERRERAGVTQTGLAGRSGMTQEMISNLERGQHEPRFATLQKYADGLGITVAALLRS
jgi:DNA-binding XRE family transcriptional regulator